MKQEGRGGPHSGLLVGKEVFKSEYASGHGYYGTVLLFVLELRAVQKDAMGVVMATTSVSYTQTVFSNDCILNDTHS